MPNCGSPGCWLLGALTGRNTPSHVPRRTAPCLHADLNAWVPHAQARANPDMDVTPKKDLRRVQFTGQVLLKAGAQQEGVQERVRKSESELWKSPRPHWCRVPVLPHDLQEMDPHGQGDSEASTSPGLLESLEAHEKGVRVHVQVFHVSVVVLEATTRVPEQRRR